MGKLVAPRVAAAVFRGLWNGWSTSRRFQQRNQASNVCLFKCNSRAEDSLEHYCRCPVVMDVANKVCRIGYMSVDALNLWVLNSAWLDIADNLLAIGLLIYGAYMTFNHCRHHPLQSRAQVYDHMVQQCKQGTAGHPHSMKFLDSRGSVVVTFCLRE